MVNFSRIPSGASVFQAYASMATSITIFRTMFNQVVPRQVQLYIVSKVRSYFGKRTPDKRITLVIRERDGMTYNQVYIAAEIYLSAKTIPGIRRFEVSKNPKDPELNVKLGSCGKITDSFEGIDLVWRFVHQVVKGNNNVTSEKRYFELSFNKENKDQILNGYIPFVLDQAKIIYDQKKVVKLHSLSNTGPGIWNSVNLEHPSTFETLALEPELKKAIIEDLDRFLKRKEYYRKVGKAWKRGYLLYGPPGTGKSSLIAAVANYLKFDIYDLELSDIRSDHQLRRSLLDTKNRSILVIEDIDCTVNLPTITTKGAIGHPGVPNMFTLAGFLNIIDGLWSCLGDERVIIFTTNHKEKLEPALLRPGRMDMHIHMSYLTPQGFKTLASNYVEIHDHSCFQEVQELIGSVQVTPAEVAEELMRSEDPDVCLGNLVNFLKRKRDSNDENDIGLDQTVKRRRTLTEKEDGGSKTT